MVSMDASTSVNDEAQIGGVPMIVARTPPYAGIRDVAGMVGITTVTYLWAAAAIASRSVLRVNRQSNVLAFACAQIAI